MTIVFPKVKKVSGLLIPDTFPDCRQSPGRKSGLFFLLSYPQNSKFWKCYQEKSYSYPPDTLKVTDITMI